MSELLRLNPSPCIPGLPLFGQGFGTPLSGGQFGRGGNRAEQSAGGMTPEVANALNELVKHVNQLGQAIKTMSQISSKNFRDIEKVIADANTAQSGGFAVLLETLYQGQTAMARRLVWGNPGFFPDGDPFEVVDFYLEAGGSIEANTKIEVRPYQGVLVVCNFYCTPSDVI